MLITCMDGLCASSFPVRTLSGCLKKPLRVWQKTLKVEWLKERYGDDKGKGCYVECDLYAPPSIHDKTAYYPLAPVTGTVDERYLSAFQKEMHQKARSSHDGKTYLLLQISFPRRDMAPTTRTSSFI